MSLIGYDSSNIEFYLFFGQKFIAIRDQQQKESVKVHIKCVLKFISKRKRSWSLIFFHATQGSSTDVYQLIQESYNELEEEQKEWFQSLVVLYQTSSWFTNLFSCRKRGRNRRLPEPLNFADLHTFLKQEKAMDVKFT